MCPPTFFSVSYAINPWMDPTAAVDRGRAQRQWQRLRDLYLELGHEVEVIAARPELPDMVFAANGGLVIAGRALGARFAHPERGPEGEAYLDWFTGPGRDGAAITDVVRPVYVNEGEGDLLVVGDRLLAGTGFRTDPRAHAEVAAVFGLPVTTLHLVDPRFYHLDTALAVLDHRTVAYYPSAFRADSQRVLAELYPDALIATADDAAVLGLNAVSDGLHVVHAQAATSLAAQLRERGYEPVGVDLSELLKAGGGAKCATLELRGWRH